jgi:hypothetical protein
MGREVRYKIFSNTTKDKVQKPDRLDMPHDYNSAFSKAYNVRDDEFLTYDEVCDRIKENSSLLGKEDTLKAVIVYSTILKEMRDSDIVYISND